MQYIHVYSINFFLPWLYTCQRLYRPIYLVFPYILYALDAW